MPVSVAAPAAAPRSLLDAVRARVRYLHYSLRTEQAYVHWIRAFVRFHDMRHPRSMGQPEVEAFLTWLSNERGVSVATHRQALAGVLFLYQQVLGQQLPWMRDIGRPQRKARLPVVLSPSEVAAVLDRLEGTHGVLARLLYGTGMRITGARPLRRRRPAPTAAAPAHGPVPGRRPCFPPTPSCTAAAISAS